MSEHNVPGYLAWFLLYGTEDGTNREKRRQIALNSFALFNGLFTLAFAIFYPLYNIDLWPLFFVLVFLSAVTFALPLISRFGDMIALAWTTFFWSRQFTGANLSAEQRLGIQFYFFIIPVSVLTVLGTTHKFVLAIVTGICLAGFSVCHRRDLDDSHRLDLGLCGLF